ncbi:3-oxoacyl-[acyl-carrier-protein] reductase [Oscillospiraceae bacterium PP1C4]
MNKVAVVTGAKQGIGRAIAISLAQEGFDVAINCRNQESAAAAREVVKKCMEYGVDADCFTADVSNYAECAEMVKRIMNRFTRIDVLVNNAGITRDGLIARMSEGQYDEVIAANQKSVFNMMRQVTPIMMKQREGRIINITSVVGLYGNAGQLNYAASKAAIVGMTKTAAKELGARNITVNAVAPGMIQTDMSAKLPEKVQAGILDAVSLKRMGTVEDVANAVCFLAGDKAAYISGQVLCVDGGIIM